MAGAALVPSAAGDRASSQVRSFQAGLLDTGSGSSCVVTANRGVRCWGARALGNGTNEGSSNPVPVSGIDDARSVTVGSSFACAVRETGGVNCWGSNFVGQLGNGEENSSSPVPTTVVGLIDARAVSAGTYHACAVLADGSGRCWGSDEAGELGDGPKALRGGIEEFSRVPVVVDGLADARAISAGQFFSCALIADGSVRCWGFNGSGRLGDGSEDNSPVPVPVTGLTNAVALSAGAHHACALLDSGGVRCWGSNNDGQLGDGTTTGSSVPVTVPGLTDVIAIATGGSHTCALLAAGSLRCWGENSDGGLGDGTTTSSSTPVAVSGIANAVAVSAGVRVTCALLASGSGRCWGRGTQGQLGNGGTSDSATPVAVPMGSIGRVADLSVGLGADPTDPPVGSTTTLTATVTNDGPDTATSVSLAVPVPPGLQRQSHVASQGAYNVGAGFWAVGTLAPGQGETLQLELRKAAAGSSTASVEVAASAVVDPDTSNDSAELEIGTGQALQSTPDVRLFVTPRRDRFARYRFALTALVDLPPGVQPAACTGTVTYGFFFAPLIRLRAIRTREVIQAGNLCGFRFNVVIPIGLTRAIFRSNRILVLRSLSRFDGNAQLQQTLSNNVLYGAG